jgi:hypothetical protein
MRTPVRRRAPAAARLLSAATAVATAATALVAATPATPPAPPAPAPRVVTITAREFFFEMPDTLVAGRTELRLVNRGGEMHHAWLVRLDRDHTPAEFFAVVRRTGLAPEWAQQVGGPNTPRPGGTSAAVLDLAPGRYLVLCGMPSPDGQPHLRQGMLRTFTVVPAAAATPARRTLAPAATSVVGAPDVTLTLTDAGFALSQPLVAGRHVLRVRNQGSMVHEVIVARLKPGVTAERALDWLGTMQGPAPMTPLGGVVGLARGESNDVPIGLTPGEYALLCRQPDLRAERGFPATHRMMQQFTVK